MARSRERGFGPRSLIMRPTMKVVALSDPHGNLPEIPPCDLLLLAGDLCPTTDHDPRFQARWLNTMFRSWLEQLPAGKIVGIAGNHDFVFERAPDLVPPDLPWTYLQDVECRWRGLRIWGTPWQPWFYDWAFNGDPELLESKWELIPPDTDVIVVHGPPRGYGDGVVRVDGGAENTGCPHLLAKIAEVKPRLVVFGHIHEGRGQWQLGPTTLANVTLLDVAYRVRYQPWEHELPDLQR